MIYLQHIHIKKILHLKLNFLSDKSEAIAKKNRADPVFILPKVDQTWSSFRSAKSAPIFPISIQKPEAVNE